MNGIFPKMPLFEFSKIDIEIMVSQGDIVPMVLHDKTSEVSCMHGYECSTTNSQEDVEQIMFAEYDLELGPGHGVLNGRKMQPNIANLTLKRGQR